jgi:hypothetical protein
MAANVSAANDASRAATADQAKCPWPEHRAPYETTRPLGPWPAAPQAPRRVS